MDARSRDVPFRLQSAHTLFSGSFTSSRRVLALRSVVALSCRDIVWREGGKCKVLTELADLVACFRKDPTFVDQCSTAVARQHQHCCIKRRFLFTKHISCDYYYTEKSL